MRFEKFAPDLRQRISIKRFPVGTEGDKFPAVFDLNVAKYQHILTAAVNSLRKFIVLVDLYQSIQLRNQLFGSGKLGMHPIPGMVSRAAGRERKTPALFRSVKPESVLPCV